MRRYREGSRLGQRGPVAVCQDHGQDDAARSGGIRKDHGIGARSEQYESAYLPISDMRADIVAGSEGPVGDITAMDNWRPPV